MVVKCARSAKIEYALCQSAKRALACVLLLVASLSLTGCGSYDWHQKLTVIVDTPDGPKTGEAVTAVSWRGNPVFRDGADYDTEVEGEAVVVEVVRGRYLFMLLDNESIRKYIGYMPARVLLDPDEYPLGPGIFAKVVSLEKPLNVPLRLAASVVTFAGPTRSHTHKR
jgi:hypothetical protein